MCEAIANSWKQQTLLNIVRLRYADIYSKRTMMYLKVLLALADTKQKDAAPALTIRAN